MAAFENRSDFIDFVRPFGKRVELYDKTRLSTDQPENDAADPFKKIPEGFINAMTVREEVFIKEQGCSLENEVDEDDPRSFHWVAYASVPIKSSDKPENTNGGTDTKRKPSTSSKIPIGTIRLVPPPHDVHPHGYDYSEVHDGQEPYAKLGRLAVIPEFRKTGISRLLIDTALHFIREHPWEVNTHVNPTVIEAMKQEHSTDFRFDGLVLVHAQVGVQKVWKKHGFERDASMGQWDEEGIAHVGMWKRVDTKPARRNSKIILH